MRASSVIARRQRRNNFFSSFLLTSGRPKISYQLIEFFRVAVDDVKKKIECFAKY